MQHPISYLMKADFVPWIEFQAYETWEPYVRYFPIIARIMLWAVATQM
jgi:hypothetical protein